MTLSRRNFNKYFLQVMLAGAMGPVLLKQLELVGQSEDEVIAIDGVDNKNLLEKVSEQVKSFVGEIKAETELLVPTFLGNDQRRFYGRGIPKSLKQLNRFELGSGVTAFRGFLTWSGAGWTGQPTLVKDRGRLYLIIGAFDHSLRKIDLETNQVVWRYKFDDIIKGTATIYIDETAKEDNRVVVLQGSRLGVRNSVGMAGPVPSFRAVSFRTGKEIWKLNIRRTDSYSRDNDSSAIDLGDMIFNAGENGIGYFLNRSTHVVEKKEGLIQPKVLGEVRLYETPDISRHGGNLVAESSPARLKDKIYFAAGSGHIYGISIPEKKIIWDFYTGSDIDGSVVISKDEKLFCAIEKQYIPGNGGVFKLNPQKKPEDSVEWFLPTGNVGFSDWQGGVIGTASINDEYRSENEPALFATNAIDGHLYIGSQKMITGQKVKGPLLNREYDTPLIVFKKRIGASISTPIFTDGNKLVTGTYNGVYLFNIFYEEGKKGDKNSVINSKGDYVKVIVEEAEHFKPGVSFESTPVVWDGIVRICGRDGWMYTLG